MLFNFWAAKWGGPECEGLMAHNQEMLTKNAQDWGSKVRIVGLSIDESIADVKALVEKMGWDKVEHFWCGPESKAKEEFNFFNGVPHVVLVDTEGKIVFVGHPSKHDFEADINTLLKGEQLTNKKEVESAESALQ